MFQIKHKKHKLLLHVWNYRHKEKIIYSFTMIEGDPWAVFFECDAEKARNSHPTWRESNLELPVNEFDSDELEVVERI